MAKKQEYARVAERDEKGRILPKNTSESQAIKDVREAARQEKAEKIIDEYSLPDANFDPSLDMRPEDYRGDRQPSGSSPTPAAQPKHSPRLLKRAEAMGMTPEEADGYSSEQLDDMLWRIREEAMKSRHNSDLDRKEVPSVTPAAGVAPQPPPVAPKHELDLKELTDAGLTEEFAKTLKGSIERLVEKRLEAALSSNERLSKLEEGLKHIDRRVQSREQETENQQLDRLFGELGDSYESVVGKGAGIDLSKSDKASFAARMAIIREASSLAGEKGDYKQHLKAAAETLYGRLVKTEKRPSPAPKAKPAVKPADVGLDEEIELEDEPKDALTEQWERGGMHRPTSRTPSPEPKGTNRAVKAVREQMIEAGEFSSNGTGTEEDGIPD